MIRPGLLAILFLLSGCAVNGTQLTAQKTDIPPLVWPQAPQKARIELVSLFSKAEDLGLNQSFFSRLKTWLFGAENEQFVRPYAIAVNQEKILVADPDARVVHLFDLKNMKHKKIDRIGGYDLKMPIGVSMSEDQLFISDSALNRVFIVDHNLNFQQVIDGFNRPTGLAFDALQQQLYVTDTLAHQVRVYDKNGNYLLAIGDRGEQQEKFNFPSHIAFRDDHLFVNDTMNFRIQVFQGNGQYINSFGQHGDAIGAIGQSKGIAIDPDGHIYIADALASRIQIFDQNGVFLLDFGSLGTKPGQFTLPAGMAFWDDKLYVADSYNGRVQVFRYLTEEN